jgi:hypothetical protein
MKAQDITKGDKFTFYVGDEVRGGWTAIEDAVVKPERNTVYVHVKYLDGGTGWREFDMETEVPID